MLKKGAQGLVMVYTYLIEPKSKLANTAYNVVNNDSQ